MAYVRSFHYYYTGPMLSVCCSCVFKWRPIFFLSIYRFTTHKELLSQNFHVIGKGKGEEEVPLVKDSDSVYSLWATGRQNCNGMAVVIKVGYLCVHNTLVTGDKYIYANICTCVAHVLSNQQQGVNRERLRSIFGWFGIHTLIEFVNLIRRPCTGLLCRNLPQPGCK